MTITAAEGCETTRTTFAAGGITFKITNKDATAVSEVELLSGERILGEKENLPAGLGGEFAVTVGAGTYTLYCPGAATERSTITVTGKAAPVDDTLAGLLKSGDRRVQELRRHPDRLPACTAPRQAGHRAARHRPRRGAGGLHRPGRTTRRSSRSPSRSSAASRTSTPTSTPAPTTSRPQVDRLPPDREGAVPDQEPGRPGHIGRQAGRGRRARCSQGQATLTYPAPDLANGAQGLLDEVAAARSPARRSGTRTSTCSTWRTTSRAPSRRSPTCSRRWTRSTPALAATIAHAFTALDTLLDRYRTTSNPSGYVLYSDAHRRRHARAGRGGQGGAGAAVAGGEQGGERLMDRSTSRRDVPRRCARRRRPGRRGRRGLRHRPRRPSRRRRLRDARRRCRSTARTRPASPPRRRTGWRSRRSTSRRTDRTAVQTLLAQWAAAAAQMTRGLPIGAVETAPDSPPIDTGEALGPGRRAAHRHRRLRPVPVRRPVRAGRAPAGRAGRPAGAARRRARARPQQRRPLRAGLRQRPAGRLPRHPQLRPAGPRHGGDALVAARLRPHVVDVDRAGDAAQPDGLQGRHPQHQGRVDRGDGRVRLGRRRDRPGLDERRQLPGGAADPDADRVVGHRLPRRPGEGLRPGQGHRRPAHRDVRVRHPGPGRQGQAGSRSSTSTRTSGSRRRRATAGR